MTHLAETVAQIETVLARAQIRDADLWRGLRAAIGVLHAARDVEEGPPEGTTWAEGEWEAHAERVHRLAERTRSLALPIDGVPIEDVERMVDDLLSDKYDDAEAAFVEIERSLR